MNFENVKDYFENLYKNTKYENAVSFLDYDFPDLDTDAKSYGVWITWSQDLDNEPRLIKLLKTDNFIRNVFINDFQDYIVSKGGNPTEFEMKDYTKDYDAFRVYHIKSRHTESKKLVNEFLRKYF